MSRDPQFQRIEVFPITGALGADVRGVVLTVDAQCGHSFLGGDIVDVTTAAKPLVMFRSAQSFFDVMRDKLHWGARSAFKSKARDGKGGA